MDHSKVSTIAQYSKNLTDLVNRHLEIATITYQHLPKQDLDRVSASGGWSITQCLDHLNSYGHHYLPIINDKLNEYVGEPMTVVKRGWLGNYFIKMMDPDIKTAKYKAIKKHHPTGNQDAYEVVSVFIRQQKELLKLIALAGSVDLNKPRIPTSISSLIRLRLGDTLSFVVYHNERHVRQAGRNIF